MSIAVMFFAGLARVALGSLLLLVAASLAVLLVREPARRIRVIQWTLAGLVVLPCLMFVPGYPRFDVLPEYSNFFASDTTGRDADIGPDADLLSAAQAVDAAALAEPLDVAPAGGTVGEPLITVDAPAPLNEPFEVADPSSVDAHASPLVPMPDETALAIPITTIAPVPGGTIEMPAETPPAAMPFTARWRLPVDYRVRVVAAYAIGVTAMALWSLVGLVAVKRLLRSARSAPPECRIVLRAVGGPRSDRVALVVSTRTEQPCALAWRRTTIVLPQRLVADTDPHALRWALAHEWSHVERRDLATWTASGIVRWFYFYQPLVWWLRGQLQLCQDFVADGAAARAGGAPEDYAEFLTTSSFTRPTLAAGLGIGGRISDLRRRVIMLVDRRRPLESTSPRRWNLVVLPVAVALVTFTAGLAQKEETPEAVGGASASSVEPRQAEAGEEATATVDEPKASEAAAAQSQPSAAPGPVVAEDATPEPTDKPRPGTNATSSVVPAALVEHELQKDPVVAQLLIRLGQAKADLAVALAGADDPAKSPTVRELNKAIHLIEEQIEDRKASIRPHVVELLHAQSRATDPVMSLWSPGPPKLEPGERILVEIIPEDPKKLGGPTHLGFFHVEPEGTLPLGAQNGRVTIAGLTVAEAENAVADHMKAITGAPHKVQISRFVDDKAVPRSSQATRTPPTRPAVATRPSGPRKIATGDALRLDVTDNLGDSDLRLLIASGMTVSVDGDGNISLGSAYGSVDVAASSLAIAEQKIALHLKKWVAERATTRVIEIGDSDKTLAALLKRLGKSAQINVRLSFADGPTDHTPRPAASATWEPTPQEVQSLVESEKNRGRIQPGDTLRLEAEPKEAEVKPVSVVEADGSLALGVRHGRVKVAGETLREAEEIVQKVLEQTFHDPEVQITFENSGTNRMREPEREVEQLKEYIRGLRKNQATHTDGDGATGYGPGESYPAPPPPPAIKQQPQGGGPVGPLRFNQDGLAPVPDIRLPSYAPQAEVYGPPPTKRPPDDRTPPEPSKSK